MIETIELTPAVVGLGDLHEPGLLALFADTHYRILTHGGEVTARAITSKAGEPLYPSIFALHLRVPSQRLLTSHTLWHRFDVGVEVRSFGRQFLEVKGVIGKPGEVPEATEAWDDLALPRVSWSGAWTLTRRDGEHELAMPSSQLPVDAPRLARVPAALAAAREAHVRGSVSHGGRPGPGSPVVRYPVLAGRDAAIGRQMMFAQFVVVMDAAERTLLSEHAFPAFPDEVLDALSTLERTIYYFGNCGAGDEVQIHATAKLERMPGTEATAATTATVVSSMELVNARTRRLLALAETKKLLAVSPTQGGLLQTIERLFSRHGEGVELTWVHR